jgi:hypothetical protein
MNTEFSFEDLQEIGVGNGGGFTRIEPPMETKEDGTLEITDFVRGVELSAAVFENDQAIFTFREKATGGTIRKWISDPLTRSYITNLDDEDPNKKKFVGYNEVINLYKNFVKPYLVDAQLREIKPINMETLTTELFKLVKPENANANEVLLKVAFSAPEGVEPKFIVPNNSYLGNEKYPPKWQLVNEKNPKYADKITFKVLDKAATDFMAPPTGGFASPAEIDEVFGVAPTGNGGEVATGTQPLNTPSVDLLGN